MLCIYVNNIMCSQCNGSVSFCCVRCVALRALRCVALRCVALRCVALRCVACVVCCMFHSLYYVCACFMVLCFHVVILFI